MYFALSLHFNCNLMKRLLISLLLCLPVKLFQQRLHRRRRQFYQMKHQVWFFRIKTRKQLQKSAKTIKDCSNCSCQETDLTNAYTYACVVFALVGVPVGAIFDKFGTMTTRLIGASLFLFGNILVLSAQNHHR